MALLTEHRLSLTQLAQERDLHVTTIWRWATRGVRGIRLETYREGGRRYTTREAHARFVAATSDGVAAPAPAARTSRQRSAAVDRAEREAAALGI